MSRAQLALDDYIKQYKAENHLGAVTVSAMHAAPTALLARQGEREHDVPPRHRN
jgi:hypothetical protein